MFWKKTSNALIYTASIYIFYFVSSLSGFRLAWQAFSLEGFIASFLFVFTANWLFN